MNTLITKAFLGTQDFVAKELKEISGDERGMEMLQVILLILMVVIIGAILWAFLGEMIQGMFNNITDNVDTIQAW